MKPRRITIWPAGLFAGLLWFVSAAVIPGVTPSADRAVYGTSESRGCGTTQLPSSALSSETRVDRHNPRTGFSPLAILAEAGAVIPRLSRGAFAGGVHVQSSTRPFASHSGRGPPFQS